MLGFQVEETKNYLEDTDESDTAAKNKEYLSTSHMRAVVKRVLSDSYRKLGIYNKERRGYSYDAIFTTSSIKQAQKYYRIFRDVINGDADEIKMNESNVSCPISLRLPLLIQLARTAMVMKLTKMK